MTKFIFTPPSKNSTHKPYNNFYMTRDGSVVVYFISEKEGYDIRDLKSGMFHSWVGLSDPKWVPVEEAIFKC